MKVPYCKIFLVIICLFGIIHLLLYGNGIKFIGVLLLIIIIIILSVFESVYITPKGYRGGVILVLITILLETRIGIRAALLFFKLL